jgi:tetratricopeptide (TPR) repeat protein
MKLTLKPSPKNEFPLGGFLIKNASPKAWILEIQRIGLALSEIELYALPNTTPNSVWGCFIACSKKIDSNQLGKNELCLMVSPNLFIAEKSILYPTLTKADVEKLFSNLKYLFHPEFGLVALESVVDLADLLIEPKEKAVYSRKPQSPIFIPKEVKSFQINPVSPEEVMKNMEETIFPQKEPKVEAPLNLFEKGKLAIYKALFTKGKVDANGHSAYQNIQEIDSFLAKIAAKLQQFFDKDNKLGEKMMRDLEDLERRNQKQVNKLLDLFKTNPEEALKYAIPLDSEGTGRGGVFNELELSKNWNNFSWLSGMLGSSSIGGGGGIMPNDSFMSLHQQYSETARQLIEKGDYQKAAFIYMKLLKNPFLAAQTLENGKFYQEAATIYFKHANNKPKAAECYEKGNFYNSAIDLYKELNEDEKVGDLYLKTGKRKEANIYFEKVVDNYKASSQYLKASLIHKNKMNDLSGSQSVLLEGWRSNHDTFNCINNYFSNIKDLKILKTEINSIYANDVNEKNRLPFLEAIRHEFHKKNELSTDLKEIAYEVIAAEIPKNPSIVQELKAFNPEDKELLKDTMRFKAKVAKKR